MKTSNSRRTGMPTEKVYVPDRASWRKWLRTNHAKSTGIWLVFDKQSARKDRLPYADAVEEALCFGWIDSTLRPLDEKQYMQLFTPRKPKSSWSKVNKDRVTKLIDAGLMHASGASAIAEAKRNGSWSKIDAVEALTMPPDLRKALDARKGAFANFNAFPKSARKGYLHWIQNCKRPETRAERIRTTVECAAHNVRYRQDLPPSKR